MRSGDIDTSVPVGSARNQLAAPAPDCDLSIAWPARSRAGKTTCSRKWVSRAELAWNCHPRSQGAISSASSVWGGCAPAARSRQDGASKPSASNTCRADASAPKLGELSGALVDILDTHFDAGSDVMLVEFTSDESITDGGFQARYTCG